MLCTFHLSVGVYARITCELQHFHASFQFFKHASPMMTYQSRTCARSIALENYLKFVLRSSISRASIDMHRKVRYRIQIE